MGQTLKQAISKELEVTLGFWILDDTKRRPALGYDRAMPRQPTMIGDLYNTVLDRPTASRPLSPPTEDAYGLGPTPKEIKTTFPVALVALTAGISSGASAHAEDKSRSGTDAAAPTAREITVWQSSTLRD